VSSSPARRATFRDVFAIGEFRALWASQILSVGGDRLALVALALLVYDRTRSPLLAAVAYAAGYVPYVIGALFLSGLADRLPRREVMVACDVVRAVLVAAMLVPRIPLDGLIVLLYVTTAIQPPFDAARSAILADIVQGERYALAAATMQTTFRVAIVAGAAAGGVVVALAGARFALGVDAATFVASAIVVRFGTAARPSAAKAERWSGPDSGRRPNPLAQLGAGVRVVFGDKALCTLVLLGWLAALYEIPEGLAAPYASRLGGGPVAAGLLIASGQVGAAVAMPVFTKKIGPLTRLRWMGPMAVCACVVLILTALRPSLVVSMAIFAMAGTFAIYQIAANTAFVARVPNERRAQAFGLANAGLIVGQGLAFTLAGAAAEVVPPSTVIALSGGLGALAACGLALRWRRMSPAVGRHSARHFRGQAPLVSDQALPIRDQAPLAGQAPLHMAHSRLRVRG
jgi:predicted MFS family arabinose efflux permease